MAAGRQISRKSYSSRSEEVTISYKNQSNQRTFVTDHEPRRHRYVDGDYNRPYRGRASQPINHHSENRNRSDGIPTNDSRSDATKKRKFSPIVWDNNRSEKQVKITSKSRILPTSPVLPPSPPSKSDAVPDTKIETSSVESLASTLSEEVEATTVPSSFSANTPHEHTPEEHDQELDHEDGEYVEERNLSKSKWAFKDSPQAHSNNSSPESGEFKQEPIQDSIEEMSCVSADEEDELLQQSKSRDDSDDDDDDRYEAPVSIIPSCRNVYEYERLGKISEGTYGVVHKARDKKTGEIVALKKVKTTKEREGFPITALREITILGTLKHPSIVQMKEVVTDDFDGVYMVMEYVHHELKSYMEKQKQPFSQSEVKRLILQLLQGLSYLHKNWVIHRDLKTSNLLLTNSGDLKICDFGMSRQYGQPIKPYTSLVVTLWYRAPEILLGMKNYTSAIDMWSVGCIMGEMLGKKPMFDGGREVEQIEKIYRTLGTPNEVIWPGYGKLPGVKMCGVKERCNNLRKRFPAASFMGSPVITEMGFDLLNRFLTYDPSKRISADEALEHGWFRESPLPAECVRICK